MDEVLDFDQLVDSYYENLVTTLRNFAPGPEYLDSWVHDENPNESIYGLFEAAFEGGADGLEIKVSPKWNASLDRAKLFSDLKKLGRVSSEEKESDLRIQLIFKTAIHPAYKKALERKDLVLEHQGELIYSTDSKMDLVLKASDQGTNLACLVNQDGIVLDAKFSGSQGPAIVLMEEFCSQLIDRSLREGAEHGVIRLELFLRDSVVSPPVAGVITPGNSDPIFSIPKCLIRKIYSQYLQNHPETDLNQWEDPLSPNWEILPEAAKHEKAKATILEICRELSLPYQDIEVVSIKNGRRIFLSHPIQLKSHDFGHHLMGIEMELKKRLDPQLELGLESLEDRNKREARTSRKA